MKRNLCLSVITIALMSVGFGAVAADTLDTTQIGDRNDIDYRSWGDNDADFKQIGDDNLIDAGDAIRGILTFDYTQTGDHNTIINGDVNYNTGTTDRNGSFKAVQKGDWNSALLNPPGESRDIGPHYIFDIRQTSIEEGNRTSGQKLKTDLYSTGNEVYALQDGTYMEAGVYIGNEGEIVMNHGGRNKFYLNQYGIYNQSYLNGADSDVNSVDIDQYGERNIVRFDTVYAVDNSPIKVYQNGERNEFNANISGLGTSWGQEQAIELGVDQRGERNFGSYDATALQGNEYDLDQNGDYNRSATITTGAGHMVYIDQTGDRNTHDFTLSGENGDTNFYQNGDRNTMQANVTGNTAHVDFDQKGGDFNMIDLLATNADGLVVDIVQTGSSNKVYDYLNAEDPFTTNGKGNTIDIVQTGNNNIVAGEQKSGGNLLEVTQIGDSNIATVRQTSYGNTMNVYQNGDGNSVNLSQF